MKASALVLRLVDRGSPRRLVRALTADPRLQLGVVVDGRLPLLALVTDPTARERLVEELRQMPGVRGVDVVMTSIVDPVDAFETDDPPTQKIRIPSRTTEAAR